ncbi:hypothetical protein HOLleu_18864 [Holothuria leucospilota]|uniref:Uncharacterized protein n=1 Tax=Holothuria leucospilota TaxID=206669 RepID=A0A9Q1C3H5_HOLLE|nr:hypothetical protein HOLleu_18864 [Holothuria leucospilota]
MYIRSRSRTLLVSVSNSAPGLGLGLDTHWSRSWSRSRICWSRLQHGYYVSSHMTIMAATSQHPILSPRAFTQFEVDVGET